jgi:hypothetical protein
LLKGVLDVDASLSMPPSYACKCFSVARTRSRSSEYLASPVTSNGSDHSCAPVTLGSSAAATPGCRQARQQEPVVDGWALGGQAAVLWSKLIRCDLEAQRGSIRRPFGHGWAVENRSFLELELRAPL